MKGKINMKKLLVILLAFALTTSFAACGGNEEETSSVNDTTSTVSDVAPESEEDVVSAEASLPEAEGGISAEDMKAAAEKLMVDAILEMPADAIYNDTGINPESFAEGFWICEETGNSAETVAFYIAKSDAEGEEIRTLLSNKLTSLQNQYKDYNADNYQMTLDAVVGGSGVYAYMVISTKVADIKGAIEAVIA